MMANSQEEKHFTGSAELVVAEYTALREEILKLTDVQTQLIIITLASFGSILTFGTQYGNSQIMLAYPLLAFFLALGWINNAHGIDLLGKYIQEEIELKVGVANIGWENYSRKTPSTYTFIAFWGARAIFFITQVIALIAGITITKINFLNILLILLAIVCTVMCVLLFSKISRTHGKGKRLVG